MSRKRESVCTCGFSQIRVSMVRAMIQILPAAAADLPAISALAGEIWRACYPGIITREQIEYMLGWMYNVERLEREISQESITYERLIADGTLVGFAAWGPSGHGKQCKLHKIYLRPGEHGKGLGSKLLSHVVERARAAGFNDIILQVNKANTKAIAAYERNGFVTRASIKDDIGEGFVMDDYVMGRTL